METTMRRTAIARKVYIKAVAYLRTSTAALAA
jgi:hypothetical protein